MFGSNCNVVCYCYPELSCKRAKYVYLLTQFGEYPMCNFLFCSVFVLSCNPIQEVIVNHANSNIQFISFYVFQMIDGRRPPSSSKNTMFPIFTYASTCRRREFGALAGSAIIFLALPVVPLGGRLKNFDCSALQIVIFLI
jgi:hypothetical protein